MRGGEPKVLGNFVADLAHPGVVRFRSFLRRPEPSALAPGVLEARRAHAPRLRSGQVLPGTRFHMVQVHLATALSRRVLSRWRAQGFDLVNQFPSGFCSPLSSRNAVDAPPSGYSYHAIDSLDAVWAVAGAIERGAAYTYRELGSVGPISAEALEALRGVRVLVVEDRPDTRDLVNVILETCGAKVDVASSATEALERLDQDGYDLIVADIMMPETDGFLLMRVLRQRQRERGGATPAIALTALDEPRYRDEALEAGYQIYLMKPVAPAQLVEAAASLAG